MSATDARVRGLVLWANDRKRRRPELTEHGGGLQGLKNIIFFNRILNNAITTSRDGSESVPSFLSFSFTLCLSESRLFSRLRCVFTGCSVSHFPFSYVGSDGIKSRVFR